MKTTLDIPDALLRRAKAHAKNTGRPLRAVVEESLRRLPDEPGAAPAYELPDLSVGDADAPDPLENYSWQDLREEIYGRARPK